MIDDPFEPAQDKFTIDYPLLHCGLCVPREKGSGFNSCISSFIGHPSFID